MALKVLPPHKAFDRSGDSRSGGYAKVASKTYPPKFPRGPRGRGFFEHEVEATIAARSNDATDDQLRLLVERLVSARPSLVGATAEETRSLVNDLVAECVPKIRRRR